MTNTPNKAKFKQEVRFTNATIDIVNNLSNVQNELSVLIDTLAETDEWDENLVAKANSIITTLKHQKNRIRQWTTKKRQQRSSIGARERLRNSFKKNVVANLNDPAWMYKYTRRRASKTTPLIGGGYIYCGFTDKATKKYHFFYATEEWLTDLADPDILESIE